MIKYIIFGLVGIIIIGLAGRGIWAWQQVKNAEQQVKAEQAQIAAEQELLAQQEMVAKEEEALRIAEEQKVLATIPSATLTINYAASTTVNVGEPYVLAWSSTNADGVSEVSVDTTGCMDKKKNGKVSVDNRFATPSGTETIPSAKKDIEGMAGCLTTFTYMVKNTESGKETHASVEVLYPKTAALVAKNPVKYTVVQSSNTTAISKSSTATLTINGLSSVVVKVDNTHVLEWSSTNIVRGNLRPSVTTGCKDNTKNTNGSFNNTFDTTRGTVMVFSATQKDMEDSSGCLVIFNYIVWDTLGKTTQASAEMRFP